MKHSIFTGKATELADINFFSFSHSANSLVKARLLVKAST